MTPRRLASLGLGVVFALALLAVGVLGQAQAAAAEPLLPSLVADAPDNVFLETSTTEGGLKEKGEAKLLLRFNGYIHNVGPGAIDFRGSRKSAGEPMKAFQRVYNSNGTFKEEPSAAELVYASADGHQHWHLQRAAKYSLWNSVKSAEVAPAMKVGFCLDDSQHVDAFGPKVAVYSDANGREFCRQHQPEATNLFEGISIGWRDRYDASLAFQWVDASEVLPGEYWLREDVNPTGVIKEVAGAKAPGYATKPTIIPGFDARAESVTARSEESTPFTLTATAWNDSATTKYAIVSAPQHGSLSAVSGNQVTYTPAAGYTGADSFTYTAADPNSPFPRHPAIATVSIEVTAGSGGGERTLLAGDATSTFSVPDQTSAGREEAFQFTAKASGTVEQMQFRTNATANTGVTGLDIGVFAEASGKPGAVLGHATVSGEPPTSSWVTASGLSVPVTSGAKYWLVVLPLGAAGKKLHFNAAASSGGTGNLESTSGGLHTITAESSWTTWNQGPVGFQALGKTSVAQPTVTIEGAPASMTAGTSVQLSAHVSNDSPTVTWAASTGTITTGGLYTAPGEPPAGGTVKVTATTSKGATDQRTIEITAKATTGLLAGDATATYTVADQTSVGREETFQFTAKSSGTVEELQFRTNATANPGVTGLDLGVFAENAGKPGSLLGHATVSGQPATSSWIKAGGLSIPLVGGTKYWLAVLPLGTSGKQLHFNAATVAGGGTGNLESVTGGLGTLTAESSWNTYNQGPAGFQALGKSSGAAAVIAASRSRATAVAARRAPARVRARAARAAIAGAPSSMRAGTSVQLSALLVHGRPGVSWRASAGSITAAGLYTAPATPPRGDRVLVRASGAGGARDQVRIAIAPLSEPRAAPAAPLPPLGGGSAGSTLGAQPLTAPQAMVVGHNLILTARSGLPGRLGFSAYHAGRLIGSCAPVLTPAGRAVTCSLQLGAVAPDAAIAVSASLQAEGQTLTSGRLPARIATMG